MTCGSFPFNHLGVPIFKEKPRKIFVQPLADKMIYKLTSWKCNNLSFARKTDLVKSFVVSLLIHSFSYYKWLANMIKDLEKNMRNFIWTSNVCQRKLIFVSWSNRCLPLDEEGVGLKNLKCFNNALLKKLAWQIFYSNDGDWEDFIKDLFFKSISVPRSFFFSLPCGDLSLIFLDFKEQVHWIIGSGSNLFF